MTNNTRRQAEQVDNANPRPENKHGHIIELVEDGGEVTASTFGWELFVACGDPHNPDDKAFYQGHNEVSWLSCPDNVTFDDSGACGLPPTANLQASRRTTQSTLLRSGSPTWHVQDVPQRLAGRGVCGPAFTPDNRTFFVAIQHPGKAQESTFANPISRFPDYAPDIPPRPVWSRFIVPRVEKSAVSAVWHARRGNVPLGPYVVESLDPYVVNSPSVCNHEPLDGCAKIMRKLTKGDQVKMRISRREELPTISRPYMKKAGATVAPRRMPSSTPS